MDTTSLPPGEQFASWARHTPNTRLTPNTPGCFLARGSFWDLGSTAVTESFLDGFIAERDDKLIKATGADHYLLIAVFEGETRFEAEEIDILCSAGDAYICDFKRVSRLTTPGIHCASVAMPRTFVETAIRDVVLHGRLPRGPATDLLVKTLAMLVQALSGLSRRTAPFYSSVIRDLVAAAAREMPERRTADEATRRDIAIAYVEAQQPGTLNIGLMLDALGITRSTLYRLFEEDNGVLAYDRLCRLRKLHRGLADPSVRGGMADLGARHGFLDHTYLTKLFKMTFGYSMTAFRRRMLALEPAPDGIELVDRLSATVRQMTSIA